MSEKDTERNDGLDARRTENEAAPFPPPISEQNNVSAPTDAEDTVKDTIEDTSEESSDSTSSDAERRKLCADIFEWIEMFALYFSIGIAVLTLFFRHCPVVGESMMRTLKDGDLLIVSSFGYTPKNGDIIVCQSAHYGLDRPLVKRVIATAGQSVTVDYENWRVTVDGVTLDEDYVLYWEGYEMCPSDYLAESFTVPEGSIFVMGDNRNNSKDSRSSEIGFIDERYVIGKVVLRLFPFSDITVF